jgi:hypothetical protein
MRAAINMAWEHGGAEFQSRFDKSTAQAVEMKEGVVPGSVMADESVVVCPLPIFFLGSA